MSVMMPDVAWPVENVKQEAKGIPIKVSQKKTSYNDHLL
jgi:hypothetical protein